MTNLEHLEHPEHVLGMIATLMRPEGNQPGNMVQVFQVFQKIPLKPESKSLWKPNF